MSVYLVTGGAGFIGSHIVTGLVERGDRVRVLDNLSSGDRRNLAAFEVGEVDSGAPVELLVGDINDADAVARACAGVDGVFHEAAQVSVPGSIDDPVGSYRINVMGTLSMLEGARAAGVERFVFAASSAIYGNDQTLPKTEDMEPDPLSPYSSGKHAGEELLLVWARAYGMRTVSLRYFNIFGPRQTDDSPYSGVIAIFARRLLEGLPITIHGDGENTRDFTHVGNVVQANLLAMDGDVEPGAVFNVGIAESVSLNDLYACMAEIVGSKEKPTHGPPRVGDVRHSLSSIDRIRDQLGYEPVMGWREGLVPTLEWYRERLGLA